MGYLKKIERYSLEREEAIMVYTVLTLFLRLSAGAPPFDQVITWVENTDELKLLPIIHQEVIKNCPYLQYEDMDIKYIIS